MFSCFQCVKGNKFESDSQQWIVRVLVAARCFQCVKGNKFESDSQPIDYSEEPSASCFQCVKDSESDYFFFIKNSIFASTK